MLTLWLSSLLFLAVEGAHIPRYAQIVGRGVSLQSSYDYVIIGGGTSGLTVADRLTEDPSSKIFPLRARGPVLTFFDCAKYPSS